MKVESTQKIVPYLWFDNNAEEAATFYCSIFKNSKITMRTPLIISFELEKMSFMALNGGPMYKPTEALSLYVNCDNQEEVDYLWTKLIADGGNESMCGWLKDKYGFSWQIVPTVLGQLMTDPDQGKAQSVADALLKMRKIDIQKLQQVYDG